MTLQLSAPFRPRAVAADSAPTREIAYDWAIVDRGLWAATKTLDGVSAHGGVVTAENGGFRAVDEIGRQLGWHVTQHEARAEVEAPRRDRSPASALFVLVTACAAIGTVASALHLLSLEI